MSFHVQTCNTTGPALRSFSVVIHAEAVPRRWFPWLKRMTWWAESPDAPGWFAAASSVEELKAMTMEGLRFHTGDSTSSFFVVWSTV